MLYSLSTDPRVKWDVDREVRVSLKAADSKRAVAGTNKNDYLTLSRFIRSVGRHVDYSAHGVYYTLSCTIDN